MMNLDRFSSPLASERVNPYHLQQMIEDQRQANKKDMVDSFISVYWESFVRLPEAEEVQEHYYALDIDLDLIEDRLNKF